MFTGLSLKDLPRMFLRGAVPLLVFMALLVVAWLWETASLLAVLGALIALPILTVAGILEAEHPYEALTAATLCAALVCAGIVVDSWVLPAFWLFLAGAAACHAAAVLLRGKRPLFRFAGPPAAGLAGMAVAIGSPWRDIGLIGTMCLLTLGGLVMLRRKAGPPPVDG